MKLALLCFDGMVTVPGGRRIGEDQITDACESTFSAADGWEISMTGSTGQREFSLRSACMPEAMTFGGGYGYGFIAATETQAPVDVEAPVTLKGRRR